MDMSTSTTAFKSFDISCSKAWTTQWLVVTLKDETGMPCWATPGRYMNRKMLEAFVEELGHEHEDLLIGASCDISDLLLNAATIR
jgi:hypothetical protein